MKKKTANGAGRIDVVDFWRFFAAIMIVLCHVNLLGAKIHHLEFFVEFFFFLTGYFIFRHFQKPDYLKLTVESKAKNALSYTWKRFLGLLPYVIPIVTIISLVLFSAEYLKYRWPGYSFDSFRNIINEVLLLPSGIMPHARVIGPLWYLSVMVFIMPLTCLIAQSKHQNLFVLIMLPIIWLILQEPGVLTDYGVNDRFSLYRGIFAMLLGGVIFYLTNQISAKKVSNRTRIFLTILEIGLYLYATIVGYYSLKPYELCIVILFFATLITLSGYSYTSKLHDKLFNYLGAISLPLFMWHYGVIRIMLILSFDIGAIMNILFMLGVSTLISAIHYQIVQKCTKTIAK